MYKEEKFVILNPKKEVKLKNLQDINIKSFKVNKLDLKNKNLDLEFEYSMNLQNFKLKKNIRFSDNVLGFTMISFNEMKRNVSNLTPNAVISSEKDIHEKIAGVINRIFTEIRDLDSFKDCGKYMRAFNKINCHKTVFD